MTAGPRSINPAVPGALALRPPRLRVLQARALLIGEPEEFEPEWERPSHLVFRRAILFDVLAPCVAAHLPTPTDGLPDILGSLVTAMTGDGAHVEEFWMVAHLHNAAQRAA
ncbi:hypothetical protein [Streptomyces sp. NPDC055189]